MGSARRGTLRLPPRGRVPVGHVVQAELAVGGHHEARLEGGLSKERGARGDGAPLSRCGACLGRCSAPRRALNSADFCTTSEAGRCARWCAGAGRVSASKLAEPLEAAARACAPCTRTRTAPWRSASRALRRASPPARGRGGRKAHSRQPYSRGQSREARGAARPRCSAHQQRALQPRRGGPALSRRLRSRRQPAAEQVPPRPTRLSRHSAG